MACGKGVVSGGYSLETQVSMRLYETHNQHVVPVPAALLREHDVWEVVTYLAVVYSSQA